MHVDLVRYWIRCAALLAAPVAPHFSEHIWSSPTILGEPTSIQVSRWPTPSKPVDKAIIEAGAYMRGTIKTIRDAEVTLMKKMAKAKGPAGFDPKKAKSVRIYVATTFPEWQDTCVQIVKDVYDAERDAVDDVKIRELLTKHNLIKDKRAMPFIQSLKVRWRLCAFYRPSILTFIIETYCTIWCRNGFSTYAAVL
jgi:leucyl-tRNA synthetase